MSVVCYKADVQAVSGRSPQFSTLQLALFGMLSAVFTSALVLLLPSVALGTQPSHLQRNVLPDKLSATDSSFALNVTNCPGTHWSFIGVRAETENRDIRSRV